VFSFRRPTAAAIEAQIVAVQGLRQTEARFMTVGEGCKSLQIPPVFAHDCSTSVIGHGQSAFAAARRASESWAMFDLGWVRVANPDARIVSAQLVAVEVKSVGLWTINLSRILEVIDTPCSFGFLYATTEIHVEEGEERFLFELDVESRTVAYKLEAVSRPRSNMARLGFPITRMLQRRFARDSHRRMQEAVLHAQADLPK
jgi:uncharacterized protein (UPF0548 family)